MSEQIVHRQWCGFCGEEMRYNVPRLGPEAGFVHTTTGSSACAPMRLPARGQPIPQTVESLQEVMAKDAVKMEAMGAEIADLKQKLNQERQSLHQQAARLAALEKVDAESIFEQIKHGDSDHQAWLLAKLKEIFPPSASGHL